MTLLGELVQDLPPEPSRAIVVFVDRVQVQILDVRPRPGRTEDHAALVSFIIKFCARYRIPVNLPESAATVMSHLEVLVSELRKERARILSDVIDSEIDQLLIQFDSGVGESFGVARLNSDEKKKIHDHIERIRKLIEESDVPPRKKNALFERLAELAREVDLLGTRTDRFFAFAGDVAFVLGDMAKKAKPMLDEVKGILKIVSRSRARQEGVSLPPGDEPLQLPAPSDEV